MSRPIYDYTYLDGGYDEIRRLLAASPAAWLPAPATPAGPTFTVALSEGDGRPVDAAVTVGQVRDDRADHRFIVPISWEAAAHRGLYPRMTATLEASPLSRHRSQLTLVGSYRVPAGPLGAVADRAAGHTIAEAVVHDFLTRVAARLTLAVSATAP